MKDQGKMRIGRILALLTLAVVSISLSVDPAYAITINGNIVNMGEAKEYVEADSYLQLVAMPADGRISLRTDDRGRYIYESNLPQTKMPKAGVFSISAPGLKAGRYIIVSQKLTSGGGMFLIKKGERKAFEIKVTAGADQTTLDIGEVFIPVPNAQVLKYNFGE